MITLIKREKYRYRLERILNVKNLKDIKDINYKIETRGNLIPIRTFDKGVLKEVKYYYHPNIDKDTGLPIPANDKLILRVRIFYTRDSRGNAISRVTYRDYVLDLPNKNEIRYGGLKITRKYYDDIGRVSEGVRRRTNVYDKVYSFIVTLPEDLQIKVANLLESFRVEYINLGRQIDTSSIKKLDDWFETPDGAAGLVWFENNTSIPNSDELPKE